MDVSAGAGVTDNVNVDKHKLCVDFSPAPSRLCFHVVCLFVRLFVCGITKNNQTIFTKFGGKVANGSRKNPVDFGGNLDDVALELEVR